MVVTLMVVTLMVVTLMVVTLMVVLLNTYAGGLEELLLTFETPY